LLQKLLHVSCSAAMTAAAYVREEEFAWLVLD